MRRDIELVIRRLLRAPAFLTATVGTLMLGLGMFAVVYTAVHKILIEPMEYRNPDDLYYVWRDYGPIRDQTRADLAGTDVAELQKASDVIEGAAALQHRRQRPSPPANERDLDQRLRARCVAARRDGFVRRGCGVSDETSP